MAPRKRRSRKRIAVRTGTVLGVLFLLNQALTLTAWLAVWNAFSTSDPTQELGFYTTPCFYETKWVDPKSSSRTS